jgi:cyclic beta-1,2-glucan synthetase
MHSGCVAGAPPARAHLLSNRRVSCVLTPSGAGFLRWRDVAVTRWREDPTRDGWGSLVVLRDVESGARFAPTVQPFADGPAARVVAFAPGRATFTRRDPGLEMSLRVTVTPDHDAELRRVTVANRGAAARTIELTTYAELVLGSAPADAAHPAFSKLFVQTEWLADRAIVLATRRPRSADEARVWAAHFSDADPVHATSCETDRMAFLGRGRTLHDARALQCAGDLANGAGCVLDPVFALRRRVTLGAGASVEVDFWTVMADSREALLATCGELRAKKAATRRDRPSAAVAARQSPPVDSDSDEDGLRARLLAALLYANPSWRAPAAQIAAGGGGAPTLWAAGISGDRPIVLLRIADEAGLAGVDRMLRMQRAWHDAWIGVDVVVLNEAVGAVGDALHAELGRRLEAQNARFAETGKASAAQVFALRASSMSHALRAGLATAARVVLDADPTTWCGREAGMPGGRPAMPAPRAIPSRPARAAPASHAPLAFDNGLGGFDADAREYVITLDDGRLTPLPWINVIANPDFGFLVSAEGGGYTWSLNSQQNPLTPWPNDPVGDALHDVLYLRDLDSGELWSATALPARVASATYRVRHGKGYSVFSHHAHGLDVELTQCVPIADPVKLSRLRIANRSGRARRISITAYVEWALAPIGRNGAPTIVTSIDAATGAVFARNAWRAEFGGRVAFLDLGGHQHAASGDRTEFLGAFGSVDRPSALAGGAALSGRVGAGFDPCTALQATATIEPGREIELVVALGEAGDAQAASALVEKCRATDIERVLDAIRTQWNGVLDCVTVETPDAALDLLLNDWLLYQTLGCRLWARSAYYQASGAYGFRDQLQDVMALCVARPNLAREHILRSAARQFVEGDVQHWWLPPGGAGIRTRMSDDRLWLPYVVAHYATVTGDHALLDEETPFLTGAALADDQHESYFVPGISMETASVYEHCARAIDVSLTRGPHGLPLIGTGDWNDGMNRVGIGGRGESVWLAWFVLATIDAFAPFATARDDTQRLARWRAYCDQLRAALDEAGWDGAWFRRAYYDDGTPLGSAASDECRIDTIAQSWSVLAAEEIPEPGSRPAQAMASVDTHLMWRDAQIAPLLTPPFDRTEHDPGYIKGYPPGIRENGGQYTHGAIWGVYAFARLGDGDRAGELFSMLNPIRHADTPDAIARYRVEPYVSCADVYSVDPHLGRGGWTWYTGSGGWLYRAGLEALLGFRLCGDTLTIDPCIPKDWPGFAITYRHRGKDGSVTRHDITVDNPRHVSRGVRRASLDGNVLADGAIRIPLAADGADHVVEIVMG